MRIFASGTLLVSATALTNRGILSRLFRGGSSKAKAPVQLDQRAEASTGIDAPSEDADVAVFTPTSDIFRQTQFRVQASRKVTF